MSERPTVAIIGAGFSGLAMATYLKRAEGLNDRMVARALSLFQAFTLDRHNLFYVRKITDWTRRPLKPEQLAYARADVVHLLALHDRLRKPVEGLAARARALVPRRR